MKRFLVFFLCIAVLACLCACESDERENRKSSTASVKKEEDIPSEALIREDLETLLSQINGYAELTGMETQKSMTEESAYEITLTVNAETKYADWIYEMEMIFRKYDQGWMLDESEVLSTEWQQVRTPDTDTMVEYASEYLAEHEVYSDTYFTEYMLPMENPYLEVNSNTDSGNTVLYLSWTGLENLKHGYQQHGFWSYWEYDEHIDNWVLCPDNSTGSLGYYLDKESLSKVPNTTLDFSGTWDNSRSGGGYDITEMVTISNFSWESFDAEYVGKTVDSQDGTVLWSSNIPGHFTRLSSTDSIPSGTGYDVIKYFCTYIYACDSGEYIGLAFAESSTSIFFVTNEGKYCEIYVRDYLPELK